MDKKVTHKSFGNGRVVSISDDYIEISFTSGNKKFVFPDAFGSYLSLIDQSVAEKVKVLKGIREKERRLDEIEEAKERALQREERERRLERERPVNKNKINPSSQVVFWAKEKEADSIFTEWRVFPGVINSGVNKGTTRRLVRLDKNSACLFTARDHGQPEKNRRIIGLYMVDDDFARKPTEDGYIPAHPEYRLQLSEEESKDILFWNYYTNEKYPDKMTWNSGKSRYLDNVLIAQILKDIISKKKDTKEEENAQKFLKYFCKMNKIEESELQKPNGVLTTE